MDEKGEKVDVQRVIDLATSILNNKGPIYGSPQKIEVCQRLRDEIREKDIVFSDYESHLNLFLRGFLACSHTK